MADVDGYGIVGADGILIPDLFVDLVDGEYLSGILYKEQQDVILNGRELDGLAVHRHLFIFIIDHETAALIDLGAVLLVQVSKLGVAAELGFDPGHQLQGIKGLCDIIVRPDV